MRFDLPDTGSAELLTDSGIVDHLAALTLLGGTWQPAGAGVHWLQNLNPHPHAGHFIRRVFPEFAPSGRPQVVVEHAIGRFECALDGIPFSLTGRRVRTGQGFRSQTVYSGGTIEQLVALERRISEGITPPRVRAWGGPAAAIEVPPVSEAEVFLPHSTRESLLPWLDRFWALAAKAKVHGMAPRRGVLLVGPPGTGKTQLVRHIVTRYPEAAVHLFIAHRQSAYDDPFGSMVRVIQRPGPGAIVVIEDLDRILESGAVTREYLLNCLDGLLPSTQPTLWVATANDPQLFDPAILERPGRFDRIVRFELPDADGRRFLLQDFLRGRLPPADLEHAVAATEHFSGAALRAVCEAALLAELDGAGSLADCLLREADVIHAGLKTGTQVARAPLRMIPGFAQGG